MQYQRTICHVMDIPQPITMHKELASPAGVMLESPLSSRLESSTQHPESSTPRSAPTLTVAITAFDPVAISTLRHMLVQTNLVKEVHEWASVQALDLRKPQDVPDVIFLDLNERAGSDFAFAQQLTRLRPAAHIVACSSQNESHPDLLLQAMRSGVRDFLRKPFDRAELTSLMARVGSEFSPEAPRHASAAGKLFVVLGTKGGVGSSTVSVNFAVQLAKIPGKSAVLLDFSRPMGDVASFLDLKHSFHLRDAIENFKRLDPTLLGGLLTTHKSGLQVLAGATQLEDWQNASCEAIERVVEIAQQSFDFVVMDFGSFYSPDCQNVLQAAQILLVSEADLPGLARLHRHLGALAKLQVSSGQVRLIINRWHRHDEPALEKVENDMKVPVFARLPNNFKQVSDANVRGDSLIQHGDPLATEFNRMAASLAGLLLPKREKKSRLANLLSP
jgi:pilus assembly protein CpaE